MGTDKEELLKLVAEIKELIELHQNADGTVRFDRLRGQIALEFAKTEISKSIRMYSGQTD